MEGQVEERDIQQIEHHNRVPVQIVPENQDNQVQDTDELDDDEIDRLMDSMQDSED